jgi:hypothetical protein
MFKFTELFTPRAAVAARRDPMPGPCRSRAPPAIAPGGSTTGRASTATHRHLGPKLSWSSGRC